MISICIPIHNYDARRLVQDLHKQAEQSKMEYEFVLLDDVSTLEFKEKNRHLTQLENVTYQENSENIGLSQMRNKLGKLAKYKYLIFIDSDAVVTTPNYLQRFIVVCQPNIVCFGGCKYTEECPDKKHILRWRFGKSREEGIGRYYSCFNFLIDKEVLLKHPFSSELSSYGYEDNLFGSKLKQAGLDITFIDNPLLHPGLDTADAYLRKIDLSLNNLILIEPILEKLGQTNSIRLLKTYNQLKRLCITGIIRYTFKLSRKKCLQNLKSENPSLLILDFYKLGLLCQLKAQ